MSEQTDPQKLSDNNIIGYVRNVWDKFKIIIFVIFSIVIIAFIELTIATNISDCSFTLHRGKLNVMQPSCLHLRKDDHVYLFKTSDFNRSNEMFEEIIPKNYSMKVINQHIATQITKPTHSIKNTLENFNRSSTPVNDISNSIINLTKIRNIINPFNGLNNLASKWVMFYPSYVKPKCFVNKKDGRTIVYFN